MDSDEVEVFDAFVRERMPELLRFGHVLTGSADAAYDLVQDALERTMLAWSRVRNRDDPEGYVRRTMVNRNVSIWRGRRKERLVGEIPEHAGTPSPELPDPGLRAALADLPRRQRAVIVLRFAEDLSEHQVADLMGCSVGTVKSQTHKALAKLRTAVPSPNAGDASTPPTEATASSNAVAGGSGPGSSAETSESTDATPQGDTPDGPHPAPEGGAPWSR